VGIALAKLGNNAIDECSLVKGNSAGLTIMDDTYPKCEFNITEIGNSPLRS